MDEPTASLTDREVDSLFRIIELLRREGAGIIYISHRLDEISTIADRITVLRDGETVAIRPEGRGGSGGDHRHDGGPRDFRRFSEARGRYRRNRTRIARSLQPIFGAPQISRFPCGAAKFSAWQDWSARDEPSWRKQLFGLTPADSGSILVDGAPVRIWSPAEAIRLGIGYVPEDRRRHGVIPEMAIAANVSLANLKRVSRHGWIDTRRRARSCAALSSPTAHQSSFDLLPRLQRFRAEISRKWRWRGGWRSSREF